VTIAAAAAVLFIGGTLFVYQFFRPMTPPGAQDRPFTEAVSAGTPAGLAGKLLEIDMHLAAGESRQERVATLARLAGNLHEESRALAPAASRKDLDKLAVLYKDVVHHGIVPRARALPPEQRRQVLDPIVNELARAAREAEQVATARPTAAEPLLVIAAAAHEGGRQLQIVLQEASP
jgi:hypothetical protein